MLLTKLFRFVAPPALFALSIFSIASAQNPAPDSSTPAPDAFFFHDGDTPAVFLGDSITQQERYSTLIETYVLTRFPTWNITFRNAGWNGDTAWLSQRQGTGLKRDVLPLQPKSVLIDFGMNDARGGDGTYSKYVDSLTGLVKDLEKAGARVALVTSSPEEKYEAGQPGGSSYNVMLKKYADGVKSVADNEKVPFVDQFTPFVNFIEAGRKAGVLNDALNPDGSDGARLIPKDGVHPGWGGHLIMATAILQGLHAPAMVSSVTLDAAGRSILGSNGCTVEWTGVNDGTVQFKRTDEALPWPWPVDPSIDLALKIPGFDPQTALNQYITKVTGLTAPSYDLTIDGKEIGTYSSSDLANGVNLASVRQGPIYDQMQQILKTVQAKNDDYLTRWRSVQLFQVPAWLAADHSIETARQAELTRLDKQIADEEKSLDTLRQPVTHLFKLTPVPSPGK